ncbi:histidine phosphatase family protein [Brevibacterium daeguense]|uniref:Histidine phosphatase family protein n=1 Tax=Brevibacterium daeguense TaxID=909936 RepID=A0ABP8ENM0_9MICO|nr:histidine phosphatase family protein [Brevibacterium daeguense]
MVHIVLVRHGESHANAAGILAGRLPDIALTSGGAEQIRRLIEVLPWQRVTEVRHSTVQRCEETTEVLLEGIEAGAVRPAPEFVEVDYGEWSGRRLEDLKALPEWREVAQRPSAMVFPGGETLAAAAERAVGGVRSFVCDLRAQADPDAPPESAPVGIVVAHGDIIKAVLAAALGMPLDDFQRIAVAPGSYSVITYPREGHPTVTAMSVTARGRTGQPGMLGGGA